MASTEPTESSNMWEQFGLRHLFLCFTAWLRGGESVGPGHGPSGSCQRPRVSGSWDEPPGQTSVCAWGVAGQTRGN